MALPLYLAMTEWETQYCPMPERMAYMACHFSSYGAGLGNFPEQLPVCSMLILNDRIPVWNHDPELIARQLQQTVEAFSCESVLLDFQRQGEGRTAAIAKAAVEALGCPVGVSQWYAQGLSCPVFFSLPAPNRDLSKELALWQGREVWLEAALETVQITVTREDSTTVPIPFEIPSPPCHVDETLCCRYHTAVGEDRAVFTISRTAEDLNALLRKAEALGVTRAIGLYQQLFPKNETPQT